MIMIEFCLARSNRILRCLLLPILGVLRAVIYEFMINCCAVIVIDLVMHHEKALIYDILYCTGMARNTSVPKSKGRFSPHSAKYGSDSCVTEPGPKLASEQGGMWPNGCRFIIMADSINSWEEIG
jgi:hypothetical protein